MSLSYSTITNTLSRQQEVLSQANEFMSIFEGIDTIWAVDVDNLPYAQGQAIHGLTANSRNSQVDYRFLRFRFPYIYFEWAFEEPSHIYAFRLNEATDKDVKIKTLWKAWSKTGSASGLVAYGHCEDSVKLIDLREDDDFQSESISSPVICHRVFTVVNVFQPELMTPVPYSRDPPVLKAQDDLAIFTTSQTMIQFLRSSQTILAFLVALSALSASLQPVVFNFSFAAGWVFAGVGVVSALIAVISTLFAWMLKQIEASAAKVRQRD